MEKPCINKVISSYLMLPVVSCLKPAYKSVGGGGEKGGATGMGLGAFVCNWVGGF